MIKAIARAAHRAARICRHIEWIAQACTQYEQWQDEEAAAMNKVGLNAPQPKVAASAPSGDTVCMHETVDVTKVRDVPMVELSGRAKGLELFLKLVLCEPFP